MPQNECRINGFLADLADAVSLAPPLRPSEDGTGQTDQTSYGI